MRLIGPSMEFNEARWSRQFFHDSNISFSLSVSFSSFSGQLTPFKKKEIFSAHLFGKYLFESKTQTFNASIRLQSWGAFLVSNCKGKSFILMVNFLCFRSSVSIEIVASFSKLKTGYFIIE